MLVRLLGNVLGGQRTTGAEQKVLALLLEHVVGFLRGQIESVLVDDLLGVLDPQLPGILRDGLEDLLAEGVGERLVRKAGKLVTELGAVLAGDAPGRLSDNEITVFDSTGLAIQDLAVALAAYRQYEAGEIPDAQTIEL